MRKHNGLIHNHIQGRSFVDIGDSNSENLLRGKPALVGGAHTNAVDALRLVVEDGIRCQSIDLDGEGSVVRVPRPSHQRVGESIRRIRIDSA